MAAEGVFETTSVPGHLAPTADRLKQLLAERTLEELYEVEEQPFARGKYATVRRCRERSSGRQWAAKFLRKRRRAQELRAEALHEVAVLDAGAHCPRLVSLHQVFETSTEMVLVLELAPGGELQMVLDRDEIPEERQVAKLLKQILDGVAFLHSLNVAHLDIKPQNLVLTGDFPDCDVKLCDFGISRYISHGADIREILGTPDYIAPEVLNYEPISLATDMWSVGVLLYVLLTGCSPFGGDTKQETFCNISRCKLDFPDDLFEEVSEEAQDLIRRLIVKNPSERLSAMECLQHSWLSKFEEVPTPLALSASTDSEAIEDEPSGNCDNNTSSPASPACDFTPSPSSRCPTSPLLPVDAPTLLEEESSEETIVGANLAIPSEVAPAAQEEPDCQPIRHEESELEEVASSPATTCAADELEASRLDESQLDSSAEQQAEDAAADSPTPVSVGNGPSPAAGTEYVYMRRLDPTLPRSSGSARHQFAGLSSERRSNFKRSMDYLARKFSASTDLLEVFGDDGILEMEAASSRRSSVTATTTTSSLGEVFKCTPVFILGEEQQCSDSGSDTVSEISTDSSSDRSSIYSDDSLDFILFGKTSQGRVSFPFSAAESHSWKQRNGLLRSMSSSSSSITTTSSSGSSSCSSTTTNSMLLANSAASGLRHGPRVWPRECNGVVSKALSRFTTVDHHHVSASSVKTPNVSPSSSTSSSISHTSSSATRTSMTRSITGLEALRSRGENLVVIREPVRAGRYMRYSEVQCESVQARIRRFQVHGSS